MSKYASVYGTMKCENGDACDVKTTEMSSTGGFYGKYGAPSLIESAVDKKLRLLQDHHHRILLESDDYLQEYVSRELATAA